MKKAEFLIKKKEVLINLLRFIIITEYNFKKHMLCFECHRRGLNQSGHDAQNTACVFLLLCEVIYVYFLLRNSLLNSNIIK